MNHKRGRAKNQRAGCLMCKHWKVNGAPERQRLKASELRRTQDAEQPMGHPMFGDFECDDYLFGVRIEQILDDHEFEGWRDFAGAVALRVPLLDAVRFA